MSSEEVRKEGKYYSIIGGTFRTKVPENHPDVVVREWESTDGKTGKKYERIVHALFGKITDIQFHDGDYGKNINITLDENDDGETPIISIGTASNYGEDFLKKLPNIKLDQEVRIRPFSFTPEDSDKERRGIEITHRDGEDKFTVKVSNFFYDAETKKAKNGYPTPEGDTSSYDSDDWKLFYLQARKFLIKYAEEKILPFFAEKKPVGKTLDDVRRESGANEYEEPKF